MSSVCNNNLQQLAVVHIVSCGTDLHNNFMNVVSTHGGLVHVAFFVASVTSKGISTLNNSPTLLTFGICEQKEVKNTIPGHQE